MGKMARPALEIAERVAGLVFCGVGCGLAFVYFWHPRLCHFILWAARHQSVTFAFSLGFSAYLVFGGFGWDRA